MDEYLKIKKEIEQIIVSAEADREEYNEFYTMALTNTIDRLNILASKCEKLSGVEYLKGKIRCNFKDIYSIEPTELQMNKIIALIPEKIKHLADEWGWDDTEVRDYVYVLIRDNRDEFQ